MMVDRSYSYDCQIKSVQVSARKHKAYSISAEKRSSEQLLAEPWRVPYSIVSDAVLPSIPHWVRDATVLLFCNPPRVACWRTRASTQSITW